MDMGKGVVLLYVQNISDFFASKKLVKYPVNVVLVTEEISTYEALRDREDCTSILLDSDHDVFCDDTWKIVDKIVSEINSTSLELDNFLYEPSFVIEGGLAQSVADLIFFLDFMIAIIEKYNVVRIVNSQSDIIQAKGLKHLAEYFGIAFYDISHVLGWDSLMSKVKSSFFFDVRRVASIHNYFLSIKKNLSMNLIGGEFDIGFIQTTDSAKGRAWQSERIRDFLNYHNYAVICYGAPNSYAYYKAINVPVLAIEEEYSLRRNLGVVKKYFQDRKTIISLLYEDYSAAYKGINITDEVLQLYSFYINNEGLRNVFYFSLAKAFFKKYHFTIFSGDGESNFMSNRIVHRVNTNYYDNAVFFKDQRGLLAVNTLHIYEPYGDIIKYRFFSKNSDYLQKLLSQGWSGEYFVCPFQEKAKKIKEIQQTVVSNVGGGVLWAPSFPSRGNYKYSSFLKDNAWIINHAIENKFPLYIKYHPNQNLGMIETLKKKYDEYRNIHFLDKSIPIYELFQKVDIVITTPSTVLFEAAESGKPVVCLAELQMKERITHLLEGFLIGTREELDEGLFGNILLTSNGFAEWRSDILRKQSDYLYDCYSANGNVSVSVILKKIIDEEKSKKQIERCNE